MNREPTLLKITIGDDVIPEIATVTIEYKHDRDFISVTMGGRLMDAVGTNDIASLLEHVVSQIRTALPVRINDSPSPEGSS